MDAAAVTAPEIKVTLLTEEQQVQRDADNLVKVLEDMNCKCEDLVNKRQDAQAAWEKREADLCKADQCEADQREVAVKVRGKLLATAAVAEVRRWFMCQANKARLAAEKLQMEWEASQSLRRVWMKLGVNIFLFSSSLEAEKSVGNHCARECGGGIVEAKGM